MKTFYTLERYNDRSEQQEYIGVVDFALRWVPELDHALQLHRRKDADDLAEICDDAWTVGTHQSGIDWLMWCIAGAVGYGVCYLIYMLCRAFFS